MVSSRTVTGIPGSLNWAAVPVPIAVVHVESEYRVTVEPGSAVPKTSGELWSAGEEGELPVTHGVALEPPAPTVISPVAVTDCPSGLVIVTFSAPAEAPRVSRSRLIWVGSV